MCVVVLGGSRFVSVWVLLWLAREKKKREPTTTIAEEGRIIKEDTASYHALLGLFFFRNII